MRRAVASFVSFVQKRALGYYDRAQMTHEYCPSFLEVKHWNDFYDDAMSAEDKTSSRGLAGFSNVIISWDAVFVYLTRSWV